jgi:hypothetical protein
MSKLAEQLVALGFKPIVPETTPKITVTRVFKGHIVTMPLNVHLALLSRVA